MSAERLKLGEDFCQENIFTIIGSWKEQLVYFVYGSLFYRSQVVSNRRLDWGGEDRGGNTKGINGIGKSTIKINFKK